MQRRSDDISDLRNLGPKTKQWLNAVGIYDRQRMEKLGSIAIYRLLKERGYNVSLNLVYGIEAALLDIDWRDLPPEMKAELRKELKYR